MTTDKLLSIITIGLDIDDISTTFLSLPQPLPEWVQYLIVAPDSIFTSLRQRISNTDIQYIADSSHGVYSAMNDGLASSKGQYIWFLNSGDISLITDFSILNKVLVHSIRHNTNIIFFKPIFHRWVYKLNLFLSFRQIFLFTTIIQLMPCGHQNILIASEAHPPFNSSFKFSADFNIISSVLRSNLGLTSVESFPLARQSSGGISDINRFLVFRERYLSTIEHRPLHITFLSYFAFLLRILYLFFSNIVKFATQSL
ncbi:hypothetical protein [Synechococcus sp. MIT S9451]|uniref:hypothetical protein n=1 Tax=Synechococcus sp. MIT S9451 TaxID=3082543 RepID=UPI0039B5A5A5